MFAAGVFEPEDRLELIEGEIVDMSPQNCPHATGVTLVQETLSDIFRSSSAVRVQLPMDVNEISQPEPDIAVVKGTIRNYTNRHPAGPDVGLVIEVADSSLQMDREQKLAIYAQAGIVEYWVVNLNDNTIEVFRDPQQGSESNTAEYQSRKILSASDRIAVSLGDESLGELKVSDLLP